jgi:hypothetical protein
MFANTKIVLSTAIILGTASVTLANYALAESTSNSKYGVWEDEWVVQGDTWLRRDDLTNSRFENNALTVPAPTAPSFTDPVGDRHLKRPLASVRAQAGGGAVSTLRQIRKSAHQD